MSKLFVANWKMHKTVAEAQQFTTLLLQAKWPNDRTTVLCGPFTTLPGLQTLLSASPVLWGAQTMHWENHGAYTGEISAAMLVELGCSYVIIGHSERRRDANETDATVNKKVLAALAAGLTPIICVGESLAQHQQQQTNDWVSTQVQMALVGIAPNQLDKLVIAYEPIWAIGTGLTATPDQAQAVHGMIRQLVSADTLIIYGGSVTPDNISSLMAQPNINGALIGGASLTVESFQGILNYK